MSAPHLPNLNTLIGREAEGLTLKERLALAGRWIALEIYSPQTLPLKRIEAIGDSAEDCARQLKARGLDPAIFEFTVAPPPY